MSFGLMSGYQGASIKGRHVQESFLVARECLHAMKTQRRKGVILKLDFEKTYDRVNWSCLFGVLRKMGFHDRWIGLVRAYITSTRFAILINGQPSS